MVLANETMEFLRWLKQATTRLSRLDRRSTVRVIAGLTVNQIVGMVAFFLPIKVVLLAGSDSVPSYLAFFISEDTKDIWVVILALITFGFFLLSRYIDSVVARNSSAGANTLLLSADQVPIVSNEAEFSETTYHRIVSTTSQLLFIVMAVLAGLAIFLPLFAIVLVLLCIEFGIAGYGFSGEEDGRLKRYVIDNTKEFLVLLQALNFFAVVIFLVVYFLVLKEVNFLVAIGGLIISRKVFGGVRPIINNALRLNKDRAQANALLFPEARVGEAGVVQNRDFLHKFSHPSRLNRVLNIGAQDLDEVVESIWVDSGTDKFAIFDLYGEGGVEYGVRLYREYVYTPKGAKGLEQHDYLLLHLDAESLRCLPRRGAYEEKGFCGRVVDYKDIFLLPRSYFSEARYELLRHLWSLQLPAGLVRSFKNARLQLSERVRERQLSDLAVAADEPWASDAYERLLDRLGELCDRTAGLPLALINNNLTWRNLVSDEGGDVRLVSWTSWSLEPIGVGFDPGKDNGELIKAAARLSHSNDGEGVECQLGDILSAALLYRLEELARRGRPKEALLTSYYSLELVGLEDAKVIEGLDEFVSRAGVFTPERTARGEWDEKGGEEVVSGDLSEGKGDEYRLENADESEVSEPGERNGRYVRKNGERDYKDA